MTLKNQNELPEFYLYPGNLFVDRKPYKITTILGSCVAVCLWDIRQKFGGINHYVLPLWNGNGLATPKYENMAIGKLIEKMLCLGSQKKHLVAKIFGGATVLQSPKTNFNIGEKNIILAQDMLKEEKIPVISHSIGGTQGRKLTFYTENGNVYCKILKLKQIVTQ